MLAGLGDRLLNLDRSSGGYHRCRQQRRHVSRARGEDPDRGNAPAGTDRRRAS